MSPYVSWRTYVSWLVAGFLLVCRCLAGVQLFILLPLATIFNLMADIQN